MHDLDWVVRPPAMARARHRAELPGAAQPSGSSRPGWRRWPGLALCWASSLCALASCTSFAALDDRPLSETGGASTGGSGRGATGGGGATGVQSPPLPGIGVGGSVAEAPPDSVPVSEPGGSGPVNDGSPGAPPDAGSPASSDPVGEVDAGAPGELPPVDDTPPPPPACVGLALQLDGTTNAIVPRLVEDDFTLEAWIKTRSSLSGVSVFNGRPIFDADVIGMGSPNDFAATVLNDRVAFGVGGPDTTLQGLVVVTNDEWVHVAFTRQAANGQLQVIINGALEAVATASNRGSLSGRPELAFGGFVMSRRFIGALDEVRVWNVVRSLEQISANMRVRLTGSEEGLVGYYAFEDQGSVETADSSALGVPATLSGNPAYVASTALCPPGQAP